MSALVGARRVRHALVPLLVAGSLVAAGGAAQAASPSPTPSASASDGSTTAPTVTFGIAPASASRPDDRPYIIMGAGPGSVIYDHVAVINQSDQPLTLSLYPVSAGNSTDGGFAMGTQGRVADAGSWISLPVDQVTVPAQSAATGYGLVIVPVTVTIPANAEPGDHVAGVVASLKTSAQAGGSSPGLNLEQRTGERIYLTVNGPATPALQLESVTTHYDPGPLWGLFGQGTVTVTATLHNTGNVRMSVDPSLLASAPFGVVSTGTHGAPVEQVVPNGRVKTSMQLSSVWPLFHRSVTVTATLGQAPGGAAITLAPVTVSVGLWTVPWAWLVVLAMLVLLIWGVALGRRRRRRRSTPASPAGDTRRARRVAAGAPARTGEPVGTR